MWPRSRAGRQCLMLPGDRLGHSDSSGWTVPSLPPANPVSDMWTHSEFSKSYPATGAVCERSRWEDLLEPRFGTHAVGMEASSTVTGSAYTSERRTSRRGHWSQSRHVHWPAFGLMGTWGGLGAWSPKEKQSLPCPSSGQLPCGRDARGHVLSLKRLVPHLRTVRLTGDQAGPMANCAL